MEVIDRLTSMLGEEVGVTDWMEITQERVDTFADATGDHQWIHVDPVRAAKGPFGGTIAHGFLTLSLLSSFLDEALSFTPPLTMAVNYGLDRVRFPAPVVVGSRVRARVTLAAVKDVPPGVEAKWAVTIEGEGAAKPACVAEWLVRYVA